MLTTYQSGLTTLKLHGANHEQETGRFGNKSLAGLHSSRPDLNQVLSIFSDDAVYQPQVSSMKPMIGRTTIRSELARQLRSYKDCDCEILAIASANQFVFTERRDHVTMLHNNQRIFSSVCAVFEFNADDQVISWREYWDMGDIQRQLGLSAEKAVQLQHGEFHQ